jgi:uncharacterized membrane protein YebE (DUF533 family)
MKLSRDVFLALSTVLWADGKVTEREASALLEAARASELEAAELAAVERALTHPTGLDDLPPFELGEDEREYVYALALFLSRADGIVVDSEREAIRALGDRLGLAPEARKRAAGASFALSAMGLKGDVSAFAATVLQPK